MKTRRLISFILMLCIAFSCASVFISAAMYSCSNDHSENSMICSGQYSKIIVGTTQVCYIADYHQCTHRCSKCGYSRMFDHRETVTTHNVKAVPGFAHGECTVCGLRVDHFVFE